MGLKPFLPVLAALLPAGAAWVLLVKPQFELAVSKVGQGGIVRSDELRQEALESVREAAKQAGLKPAGFMASPAWSERRRTTGNGCFGAAGKILQASPAPV